MMKIEICGTSARCIQPMLLTAGLVGAQVEFTFDAAWDGLSRIAVFTDGLVTKDAVLGADNRCEIPHEVLTEVGRVLCVGVYGAAGDGTVVIPTVSAACGMVRSGAVPAGDESYPPAPDVAAQLLARIEALESGGGGSGGSTGEVQSVNGKTGRVELTAEDVGALPVDTEIPVVPATLPNPHKLTFSGAVEAEYDGSGAVEVMIPQGGSGGGSSWRKIKTVTLSQNAGSIEISVDEDGNPLDLSEFAFSVVGKSLGTSGNIGLKINGQLTYYSAKLSNTNTTAELKTAWRGIFAGRWLITADDVFDAALGHGIVSHVSDVKQKMTSFWYGCTSGAAGVGFQAGTVLELWGC